MTRVAPRYRLERRGQWAPAVLIASLLSAGCAPSLPRAPCVIRAEPGLRSGYRVEWIAGAPGHVLDELCGSSGGDPALRLEVAVLRGAGRTHVGARLRRELEPRLLEQFSLDGWTLACGRNFTIILNAQKSSCQVDRVVAVIGDYLRARQANDRVIVMMGLWAAPAL